MFAKRSQQRKETLEDPSLDPSRAIEDIGIRRAGSELGISRPRSFSPPFFPPPLPPPSPPNYFSYTSFPPPPFSSPSLSSLPLYFHFFLLTSPPTNYLSIHSPPPPLLTQFPSIILPLPFLLHITLQYFLSHHLLHLPPPPPYPSTNLSLFLFISPSLPPPQLLHIPSLPLLPHFILLPIPFSPPSPFPPPPLPLPHPIPLPLSRSTDPRTRSRLVGSRCLRSPGLGPSSDLRGSPCAAANAWRTPAGPTRRRGHALV